MIQVQIIKLSPTGDILETYTHKFDKFTESNICDHLQIAGEFKYNNSNIKHIDNYIIVKQLHVK
jgi:hypothetical protein